MIVQEILAGVVNLPACAGSFQGSCRKIAAGFVKLPAHAEIDVLNPFAPILKVTDFERSIIVGGDASSFR